MKKSGLLVLLLVTACRPAEGPPAGPAAGADWSRGGMVAAASPYAVAVASEILERGGHAVDAAIAAHAVLGLVEPESSGLGGSVFLLVHEHGANTPVLYDGRETAPAGATASMFVVDGQPLGFREAWQTGIGVGVPGTVAAYAAAHAQHGRLPWAELFRPAILLAKEGFAVPPKLHNWLLRLAPLIDAERSPAAAAYLYPDGEPLAQGARRDNPAYAATLERIAAEGPSAFYSGDIARDIAARAQQAPLPGTLTTADLAAYEVVRREAVCGAFRDYRICSAPPPSSGVAQVMIAGLYDRLLPDAASPLTAFVDAQRLAYADRDRYIADPAFADVPLAELIEPAYLDRRAAERAAPDALPEPGAPRGEADTGGADATREAPGTSHLSIVDADGNAVSLTASVGAPFGSLRMVHGFLLNNEMSDFAFVPVERGEPVANAVEPGKRPRSSMSPTMVYGADGELALVTGSPGGNSIVAYVAKSVLGVLDWGLTAQAAADYPNVIARGESVRVETADDTGRALAAELAELGYDVRESEGENSGLHLVVVRPDGLEGAADSRRDGTTAAVAPRTR